VKRSFLLAAILAINGLVHAQCSKTVVFKCYKGRELKDGIYGPELPVEATISLTKSTVVYKITMNGEIETMVGEINEIPICEWTDYLQNGRTRYKAGIKRDNQSAENAIIEVESQNGTTKIICSSDPETGTKLQLDVVEYTLTDDDVATPAKEEAIKNGKKTKRKIKQAGR
jgi:hypothetical protein